MKHKGLIAVFAVVWIGFVVVALSLPPISQALPGPATYIIENSLLDTGAFNVIASVITDYRAFDTLGEVTILFISIVTVFTVLHPVKEDDHA